MAKSRDFSDEYGEENQEVHMSDADLEALLAGHEDPIERKASTQETELEAGDVVKGRVIDFRGGEILVELDSKTIGAIDESEFDGDELPVIGTTVEATYQSFDDARELAVLGIREARKEIFWDDLRVGAVVEGVATEVNKGGLTVDIRGNRAFLPISQISRERIEDAAPYVGQTLVCEVTAFDREDRNIVVSRRVILEREAEEMKGMALARLSEGEHLRGRVVKVVESLGAFIDLGGVEGLLHESKIRARAKDLGESAGLQAGQELEVEVARVDRERGRIALDFRTVIEPTWDENLERFHVGDEITGWITRIVPGGAFVSIDEGLEAWVPEAQLGRLDEPPGRGAVLRVSIAKIDLEEKKIELEVLT